MIYAVLWRLSTTILGAAIGGAVLLFDVRHWTTNSTPNAYTESTAVVSEATKATVPIQK
jgi:hypothetical protein